MKFINLTGEWQKPNLGPGGDSWEFLVGVCRPVQILTLFQTKKCHFPHPFSDQTSTIHTRFQTWPRWHFGGPGCLHAGGGPQVGEVTRGGPPHLSRKRDQIKMRDYMDRRVTSLTWGPPPPCKQALRGSKSRDCTVPTLYDICRCRTA